MCEAPNTGKKRRFLSFNWLLIYAMAIGIGTGYMQVEVFHMVADGISDIIVRLLKLISLPMIFLSVVATISGMQSFSEIRVMGRKVLTYAILTTMCAAVVGLFLFKVINPLSGVEAIEPEGQITAISGSYWSALIGLVPSNALQAFLDNSVISVMMMAVLLGLGILSIPMESRKQVSSLFQGLFSAVLKITHWIVYLMPVGVWAFVTLFVEGLRGDNPVSLSNFFLYILCVVLANVIQAVVILPTMLKIKGISPIATFRGAIAALTLAVFTRSSSAALPVTLQCAQENLKISRKVSNFSLPLCATINMNGCSAFILITVLFIGGANGLTFSTFDLFMWVGIATLAAVGNAGVAMGCYFLSGALLASMNVPLTILGMILPVYTFIDMLETGVNVWSDFCVTATVDKELREMEAEPAAA